MIQSLLLRFDSTAFPVHPDEDELTNPGIYGRELAAWVAATLVEQAVPAQAPFNEDWGWSIPIACENHRLRVACASMKGDATKWGVFVVAEGGLFARFRGEDARAQSVEAVYAILKTALEAHPGVQNLCEED